MNTQKHLDFYMEFEGPAGAREMKNLAAFVAELTRQNIDFTIERHAFTFDEVARVTLKEAK